MARISAKNVMSEFKKYQRKGLSEMRPFIPGEVFDPNVISVSPEDVNNGSPKLGDMIARNPLNHNDQWLVAEKYFNENLELVEEKNISGELTFGQKLVGLNFNPSGDDRVGQVKQKFADVADTIGDPAADTERRSWSYNAFRTYALTTLLGAQMAAVKLLTWKD